MQLESNVYRKFARNIDSTPAGVECSLVPDIFYKHLNPPDLILWLRT